jgi:hypothetical protein
MSSERNRSEDRRSADKGKIRGIESDVVKGGEIDVSFGACHLPSEVTFKGSGSIETASAAVGVAGTGTPVTTDDCFKSVDKLNIGKSVVFSSSLCR